MYKLAEQRLSRIINSCGSHILGGGRIGLEKESLRVNPQGKIAQTPHPAALGSALTHPYITTDYSEALIELITPPLDDVRQTLEFLRNTHRFVYDTLEDEILWATSMPCVVEGGKNIPIAQYGNSNAGMMKTVYRRGLGYRYGRTMQVIAGVHFNYSFSDTFWEIYQDLEQVNQVSQDFISESYFGLIRNLQRFGWLIPYLFGASPAVCKSFLGGKPTAMPEFDSGTYYEPYATSLRMGDIGYTNVKESETGIKANYDNLYAYIESLTCAIETPCPEYSRMGVVANGEYRQLNANILQIENEYYSTVRPKQVLQDDEKPTLALKKRGVQYIELRSLDVNAYDPLGINQRQLFFLEALITFCLLHQSPLISALERVAIDQNQSAAAHRGRDPALQLIRDNHDIELREWGLEICDAMQGICELLDREQPGTPFSDTLSYQQEKLRDPSRTPSARMLTEMHESGEPFFHFAKRMSEQHHSFFINPPLEDDVRRLYSELAESSIQQQLAIEAADDISFETYLQQYFAQQ